MTAFQSHTPPPTHAPPTCVRPNSPFTDPGDTDAPLHPEPLLPGALPREHEALARSVGCAFVTFLLAIVSAFQTLARFTVDLGAAAAAGSPGENNRPAPSPSQTRIPTAEEVADGAQMGAPEPGRRWHVVTRGTAIGVFDDWRVFEIRIFTIQN